MPGGPGEPCTWPVLLPSLVPAWSASEQGEVEAMATSLLWNWTGQVYGICDTTWRPCTDYSRLNRASSFEGRGPYGTLGLGRPGPSVRSLFGVSCGSCGSSHGCGCGPLTALRLPWDTQSITRVTLDGVVLDPSSYTLDPAEKLLYRVGGLWPTSQDLGKPATEVGTFEIQAKVGLPVPTGGQVAAGVLAVEMWRALTADPSCALPKRVQTIARQGVTIALIDSFDDASKGRTGIFLVDSWLLSVTHAPRRSAVHSVDVRHNRLR